MKGLPHQAGHMDIGIRKLKCVAILCSLSQFSPILISFVDSKVATLNQYNYLFIYGQFNRFKLN